MNTSTLPRYAHWTPHNGTTELPIGRPLPALAAPLPTEPMHLLDLRPSLEPLRDAWNSALTVAGILGLLAVVAGFLYGTRVLGLLLLALSGSDHL